MDAPPTPDEFISPNWKDFTYANDRLDKIISEWSIVSDEAERLRASRYLRVDEDSLKEENLFVEDEMYVCNRLIDSNIRSEQPQYLSYLTQSRREAIFKALGSKPVVGIENLEANFTEVCRYDGWEKSFIRVIDGCQTHGWDTVEVVFDITKPGHFSVEHVGHENLIFSKDAEEVDAQEVLLRRVELTSIQLRNNVVKFGFSAEQVKLLLGEEKSDQYNCNKKHTVYKCFYKNLSDDLIYVGWYGPKAKCKSWLKEPEPLFLGRRNTDIVDQTQMVPVPGATEPDYPALYETVFPFYVLPYTESEDPKIVSIFGRAFLDEPSQEAASGLLSSIVNGNLRASKIFACPEPSPVPPSDTSLPKQTDIVIKAGVFMDKPTKFFNTAYPPVSAIQGYQAVTSSNKAETAKPDFAVENRKDSRKTATEVQAATIEATKLSSVQVTLLSIFMRKVRNRCWEIYSNRVNQKKIEVPENIIPLFGGNYLIKSAGDLDVVQRQEKSVKYKQSWEVFSKTPIANLVLEDIIRLDFPEEADRYIEALRAGDVGKQLVMKLGTTLREVLTDPTTGQIRPEFADSEDIFQQLEAESIAYLNPELANENVNTPESSGGQAAA